ncbi:MAG: SDR family oxidoreductase [Clostridia bacterium]|nr:SDR family oxidoreductase [Clostridia bacterium]
MTKNLCDINGKIAVITGGGGVICGTLATEMAKQGARVAVLDLSLEKAQQTCDAIIKAGGQAIALSCNVLDRESTLAAAQSVIDTYGRIDILINGAGGNHPMATTGPDSSFFDLPAESIRFVFDLNCLGSIIPSQVFGKYMADQDSGCIINIASMSSFRPLTKTLAYSSAKSAVANFTEWAAVHFAQEYSTNIRVNAIAPGFLLTAQNHYLLKNEDGTDTARGKSIITNTPMGRYGEPSELAGGVIFLCSDAAKFITGVVLPIDGGFNAFSGV